jgi:hypothetical protein
VSAGISRHYPSGSADESPTGPAWAAVDDNGSLGRRQKDLPGGCRGTDPAGGSSSHLRHFVVTSAGRGGSGAEVLLRTRSRGFTLEHGLVAVKVVVWCPGT